MSLDDAVKDMLYKLELEGQWAGWDWQEGPELFWVDANVDEGKVSYRPADALTEGLRELMDAFEGRAGEAMLGVALACEHARVLSGAGPGEMSFIEKLEPGWQFYGFAFRTEAWSVANHLNKHPDRHETRLINMVARDGSCWFLSRVRGEEPKLFTKGIVGNVVNGLTSMVNAAAGTSIPLRKMPQEAVTE